MTTSTGPSLPRVDCVEKVMGTLRYTADLPVPHALWGRMLRIPTLRSHQELGLHVPVSDNHGDKLAPF
jgi:CO/xanthine dehydrogenase Mo-binding subunit